MQIKKITVQNEKIDRKSWIYDKDVNNVIKKVTKTKLDSKF